MINIFGCDNEAVFLDIIQDTVFSQTALLPKKYAFHRFRNAEELLKCLDERIIVPHLLIIDAHFDMCRTKECADRLHEFYPSCKLMIMSEGEDDLFLSFECDSCGTISKLSLPSKLPGTLAAILPRIDERSAEMIQLTVYGNERRPERINLRYSEIIYLECVMKKVYVTFSDGSCRRVKCSVWREIMQKFCMLPFAVPHQNYIVNMNYISKMTSTTLTISPIGKCISISKYRLRDFKALFELLPEKTVSGHFLP
ncbi:MAG: LytTR family transcriptional regulator DNA-binding domain-containing protein [Huintestinicola sp.]|uniref:LytTR family transcriptional regulator DNA-binding domain-containing protein n=1 Tax=Huintestinicola sp. TaxID=2981661 RepID=UPI003F008995